MQFGLSKSFARFQKDIEIMKRTLSLTLFLGAALSTQGAASGIKGTSNVAVVMQSSFCKTYECVSIKAGGIVQDFIYEKLYRLKKAPGLYLGIGLEGDKIDVVGIVFMDNDEGISASSNISCNFFKSYSKLAIDKIDGCGAAASVLSHLSTYVANDGCCSLGSGTAATISRNIFGYFSLIAH